ncbi:hypothetical protein DSO57_1013322 [Entomophthora muscae]|uniref:Uncharacterized protein n=1 Tax=Entomophthora muscae TaxID=34485 RepID=A0ACC2UEN4_9FUNG|nr:hypothetical protein DSO57_1013322 [Entomophthora muscae]
MPSFTPADQPVGPWVSKVAHMVTKSTDPVATTSTNSLTSPRALPRSMLSPNTSRKDGPRSPKIMETAAEITRPQLTWHMMPGYRIQVEGPSALAADIGCQEEVRPTIGGVLT